MSYFSIVAYQITRCVEALKQCPFIPSQFGKSECFVEVAGSSAEVLTQLKLRCSYVGISVSHEKERYLCNNTGGTCGCYAK